jgi:hypothetical protein
MRQSHVVLCVLTFLLTRTCFAQPALTGFVLINGGTFHSGDVVTNSHRGRVRVEDFEILDHPVTNREYKKFVDATGYRAPLHWIDGKIPAGRDGIPVGIGVKGTEEITGHEKWIEDYRGRVYLDGVQAMIDMIMDSDRPITLLAIGPVPNLELALQREPRIVEHCRVVAMAGCIGKQEEGEPGFVESNVRGNVKAAQKVYSAGWDVTIAPIDTAGKVQLEGKCYAQVRDADNPMAEMVMEHYRIWNERQKRKKTPHVRDLDRTSSTLWDTVAVYLTFDESLCRIRDIRLRVTDGAITKPDPQGKLIHVAMEWKDLDAFHKMVAERISSFNP